MTPTLIETITGAHMPLDTNDFKHRLALQFRKARDEAGLTQEQAADRIGCAQGTISKIEGGAMAVGIFEAVEIAAAYGTSLTELMERVRATRISEDERALLDSGFFGKDRDAPVS